MQLLKHGLSHTLHWSKTSEHSWVKVWKKRIFGTHPLLLCVFGGLKLHYSSCVCTALWGECLSLSMCETESVWCTFFTHSVCWWCVNARRRQTLRKQDLMPSDAFPALTFPVFCCLFFFFTTFLLPFKVLHQKSFSSTHVLSSAWICCSASSSCTTQLLLSETRFSVFSSSSQFSPPLLSLHLPLALLPFMHSSSSQMLGLSF